MRVLFLNPGAALGGAETSLLDLLSALRERHPTWELRLLCGGDGPLLDGARKLGVASEAITLPGTLASVGDSSLRQGVATAGWTKWPRAAWAALRYRGKLLAAMENFAPDIVHATGLKMQILAATLPRRGHLLWHIHDYVSWRPIASKLLRLLSWRCEGALANSHSVAADLRACCPRLPWVECVYNAVDAASLAADPSYDLDQLSGAPPLPPGALRIGLVATYARWKGHFTFLDALALIPPELPWRAYVVGGPIYQTAGSQFTQEELAEAIEARGLRERVWLTGFLPNRGGIMRSLDIVVHASTKPEPFGMVLIEAMACGCAMVVSAAGGALELFEDERTALGFPPGDAEALAHRLDRLLRDHQLRERIGCAGPAWVASRFSRARLAEQATAAYLRLKGATEGLT